MIEQEPFCGVRTHFYHDASSYDMFRDRRVVEKLHAHSVTRETANVGDVKRSAGSARATWSRPAESTTGLTPAPSSGVLLGTRSAQCSTGVC